MIKEQEKLLEQIKISLPSEVRSMLRDLCRYYRKNTMYFDYIHVDSDDMEWLEDNI
jgi:hypothetical protein